MTQSYTTEKPRPRRWLGAQGAANVVVAGEDAPTLLLYGAQRGRCFLCDKPMAPRPLCNDRDTVERLKGKKHVGGWTKDHLFPHAFGYILTGNKVLACRECNSGSHHTMPTDEEIGKAICMYAMLGFVFCPSRPKIRTPAARVRK